MDFDTLITDGTGRLRFVSDVGIRDGKITALGSLPEAELFPLCEEHDLGVMAFGPMAHGLLAGTMTPDTTFGEDDWRRRGAVFEQPLFEGEHFLRNLGRVDALKEAAADTGKTVAQLALARVIANPVVSVALAGTRKPEEIEETVGAADWEMTEQERSEITEIATRSSVGV